ncbi:MAG: hypothetical protein ACTHN5_10050 [Phycisphaerae bacterium]
MSINLADLLATYAPSNAVSRQNADADTSTALTEPMETRFILLAQGTYFNTPTSIDEYPPTAVNALSNGAVTLTPLADNLFFFISDPQQIVYLLYITNEKSVFYQALATPGIMVIYSGHARHGQGACFHPESTFQEIIPGEWWNDGNGSDNGLLRFGYPYIHLPVSDILECNYHPNPVTTDQDKPPRDSSLLHPHLLQNYHLLRPYTIDELTAHLTDDSAARLPTLLPAGPFWGLNCRGDSGRTEVHLVLNCGWQVTSTSPYDLDGSNLSCRAFCCFACSTLVHNYPIVRRQYGWTKNGDDRLAYWTDTPTPPVPVTNLFLYHLLANTRANPTWEQACEYARTKTNRQTPAYTGFHSKII